MLYDKRSSEDRKSRELELLQNTLSEVDASYTWRQIKKFVQGCVFPWCEKFGTWSSNGVGADQVPNRKVSTQKEESSVLGLRELGSVDRVLNRKVQTLNPTTVSVLGPQRE